ncbi:MAG: recombinase family protein [Planctomycetaceae bacterium]
MAAAKRRGIELGSLRKGHWQGREDARLAGSRKGAKIAAERHRVDADEAYEDLMPLFSQMRTDGKSYRAIAGELNDLGHTTRRGKAWTSTQVLRIVNRVPSN